MGRPPAYIFIVRHGNRLDAADKLWHLSSPTPYDPPLTYGGWTQCRALGQRIADILRANTPADSSGDANADPARPKKRRYRIVIHSSPFLRCIQTSVAISAGIASDTLPLEPLTPLPPLSALQHSHHSQHSQHSRHAVTPRLHKSVLRLDAFLGEWLSPSYFELITPPPSSVLMIASAKAELLRKEDYNNCFAYHPTNTHTAHHHAHSHSTSSQLWGGGSSRPAAGTWGQQQSGGTSNPSSASASPLLSPIGGSGRGGRVVSATTTTTTTMHAPAVAGYVAPVPHFALSSRAPVPTGYVAHARDACVDIDYQWDSMRAPYDWGDGGEFGEEWTAMHRRFRKGLQRLVDWYATSDVPAEMVTKTIHFGTGKHHSKETKDNSEFAIDSSDDDDDDADDDCIDESIVILVSHGAGCNALIGAITKEPVLMDIGLASLSVAVRRPGHDETPAAASSTSTSHSAWTGAVHSGHPGGLVPLDTCYEMKMLANADHLRSVPTTPTTSMMPMMTPMTLTTPRPNAMASVMGITRGRHANSLSGTPGNAAQLDSGYAGHRSTSAGDVSVRRPSGTFSRPAGRLGAPAAAKTVAQPPSITTTTTTTTQRARAPSVGLWSPVSARSLDEDSFSLADGDDGNDSDMELLLSFDRSQTAATTTSAPAPTSAPKPTTKPAPFVPAPLPKKKAPSIKSTSSRYPSSLSIAHSANGDDDGDGSSSNKTDHDDAQATLDKAVRAGLPQLDIKAATAASLSASASASTSTSAAVSRSSSRSPATAGPARASPGLWSHPRVVSINSDELAHENALSKRRWTVTERPL